MSSLQMAAQLSLPDWVRARGMSVFMMVFMGGMAVGSLIWGYLAKRYGIEASLVAAAGGLLLGTWLKNSGFSSSPRKLKKLNINNTPCVRVIAQFRNLSQK
jgi:MFS family permease